MPKREIDSIRIVLIYGRFFGADEVLDNALWIQSGHIIYRQSYLMFVFFNRDRHALSDIQI